MTNPIRIAGLSFGLTPEQVQFLAQSGELVPDQGRGVVLLADDVTEADVAEGLAVMREHERDRGARAA